MDFVECIGFAAATLATVSFFPQAIRAWRTKQTKDISLPMYILFVLGVSLWLTYGLLRRDAPMIAANIVTLGLAASILVLKLRYG